MKGGVTISRVHGKEEWIEISIEDKSSSMPIVKCRMELADFAKAVTGLGFSPCQLLYVPDEILASRYGKRLETKSVLFLNQPEFGYEKEKTLLKAWIEEKAEEWLSDNEGWILRYNGIGSQQKAGSHSVTFARWV